MSHKDTMVNQNVVIAVVCVDWRMHHPKSDFMQQLYDTLSAQRIYTQTYPGPDGLCDGLECADQRDHFESVLKQTRAVLDAHGVSSARKVLVVHSECAGHEVSDDTHRIHARMLAEELNAELHLKTPFEPFIAIKGVDDFHWRIEPCR